MPTDLIADLESRDLLNRMTEPGQAGWPTLRDRLAQGPITGYIGFDPTAASLHVGSLLQILNLVRLQRAGHRPIAIVGGGTGLIGDPSGKSAERSMLTKEKLAENVEGIRSQLARFLDFSGDGGARLVNNADWLCAVPLVDFLRDIGKHFSVNQMVARDSVKLRLEGREHGISFTEFSYSLLQAYDFLVLHDRFGCELQMGGSDQWGNILDGTDLIRRLRQKPAWGLTVPLVTKADGKKFGKSESGNIWLDATLTRPFTFFQFWLNADDADVVRYLKFFTFLPLERIAELAQSVAAAPQKREAQKALAEELTRLVHGDAALAAARRATAVLFEGGDLRSLAATELVDMLAEAPRVELPAAKLGTQDGSLASVLVLAGLEPSKGRARTAIQSGAISINGAPATAPERLLERADILPGGLIVLRRGKKSWHVVAVKEG